MHACVHVWYASFTHLASSMHACVSVCLCVCTSCIQTKMNVCIVRTGTNMQFFSASTLAPENLNQQPLVDPTYTQNNWILPHPHLFVFELRMHACVSECVYMYTCVSGVSVLVFCHRRSPVLHTQRQCAHDLYESTYGGC